MSRSLIVLSALCLAVVPALATDVSGDVDGVWTAANSPYTVLGHVTVPDGQSLTIEPGVQVLFTGHFKFNVFGTLLAGGTEADSIVLTRAYPTEASKWWGMRFDGANSASHMAYCVIEYGHATGDGYDPSGGGISAIFCSPAFDHCSIRNNEADYGGGGVYCDSGAPLFTDCVIAGNVGYHSGGVNSWRSDAVFTNCTISHNTGSSYGSNVRIGISNSLFRNCIVSFGIGGPGIEFDPVGPYGAIDHCDVFGNFEGNFVGDVPAGMGTLDNTNANGDACDEFFNIQLDPLFANSDEGDFHLTSESPCIDAGNPSSPPDPDGSVADIGAFYFQESEQPTFGFTGFVTLTDTRPTNRRFELTHVSGAITWIAFTGVCPGTTGQVVSHAQPEWSVMENGDGNNGDSIIFVTPEPLTEGSVGTFVLRYPGCTSDVTWCVGDSCGTIAGTGFLAGFVGRALFQNVPNPFNPTTQVSFDTDRAGYVRLTVFNALGQQVADLINGYMAPGRYQVEFDASRLPSGVYISRLNAPGFTATRKMLLLR